MEKNLPLIGDKFPEIDVITTHGPMRLPDAFAGKWFILFSHPADFTPVCTTEFYSFSKRYEEFKKLNCELIGLSMDQIFSHIKWAEWIEEKLGLKVPFPFIADHGVVAKTLGMVHPGKGPTTVRAVFIVDELAIIRIILYYPQEIGRNMDEILRALKALQIATAHNVATPANWPMNELIQDQVIIPPAKDVETAKKRLVEYKGSCYDWWLCYKKL